MKDDILREQVAYYDARAREYDESVRQARRYAEGQGADSDEASELARAREDLRALGPFESALEIACGTGNWTRELLRVAQSVTALDASPQMLEINRRKLADDSVRYICADVFQWEPDQRYDLVLVAFWLSHVPPDLLDSFLDKVRRALCPGGCVFMIDQPAGAVDELRPTTEGLFQRRTLSDGREFTIVKVYYDPAEIRQKLAELGFQDIQLTSGRFFFHLYGRLEIQGKWQSGV